MGGDSVPTSSPPARVPHPSPHVRRRRARRGSGSRRRGKGKKSGRGRILRHHHRVHDPVGAGVGRLLPRSFPPARRKGAEVGGGGRERGGVGEVGRGGEGGEGGGGASDRNEDRARRREGKGSARAHAARQPCADVLRPHPRRLRPALHRRAQPHPVWHRASPSSSSSLAFRSSLPLPRLLARLPRLLDQGGRQ